MLSKVSECFLFWTQHVQIVETSAGHKLGKGEFERKENQRGSPAHDKIKSEGYSLSTTLSPFHLRTHLSIFATFEGKKAGGLRLPKGLLANDKPIEIDGTLASRVGF